MNGAAQSLILHPGAPVRFDLLPCVPMASKMQSEPATMIMSVIPAAGAGAGCSGSPQAMAMACFKAPIKIAPVPARNKASAT